MKLVCNPMEISYKYQHPLYGKYAYREAADPTIVRFKGMYYLFTSKCGGFYYSKDLFNWTFHENRDLEIHGYAPDARENNGYLYFCASSYVKKCKILRTKDPLMGFELVSEPFTFWDPHFYFENDKTYFYWGCSSKEPIYGIEMDSKTMKPITEKVGLISGDSENHGIDNKDKYMKKISLWQRYINLFVGSGTFIEGAYLNKINDKYYFQYATPGTEFDIYGNAVFTGDSPLGPFTWQTHNPYSIVPGGFLRGAGHGSTFNDEYGNLWHSASTCVCLNHNFERRLGLWPAGVDKDGILFCNQYFSDYPKSYPKEKFDPLSIKQDLMLLSYKKKSMASSYKENCSPSNAFDESIKTLWSSKTNQSGEWLSVDLGKEYSVKAIQVNFGEFEVKKKKAARKEYGGTISQERYIEHEEVRYSYVLEYSVNQKVWIGFGRKNIDTAFPHHLIEDDVKARFIRIKFLTSPYDQNFTISGLRVFGKGNEEKPNKVKLISAIRENNITGNIKWEKVEDAIGYNIRIGIAPDKLYNSILIYEETNYEITFLNTETERYYFAIDSFNENGITEGDVMEMKR